MGENPVITDPNMHHTIKALELARVPRGPGHLHDRDGAAGGRHLPRHLLLREGRHLHEHRAEGPARPQGGRPARPRPGTTWRSSAGCRAPCAIPWSTNRPRRCWRSSAGSGRPWAASPTTGSRREGLAWPCPHKGPPGHGIPVQGRVPERQSALRHRALQSAGRGHER